MPDGPKNDIARVIAHRLNSWEMLAAFRAPVEQPAGRLISTVLRPLSQQTLAALSSDLLALSDSLAPTIVDICVAAATLTRYTNDTQQFNLNIFQNHARGVLTKIRDALTSDSLTPLEFQLSCGLVAYCVQHWELAVPTDTHEVGPSQQQLAALAQRFINTKLFNDGTPAQLRSVTWCTIVFGSFLLQDDDALRDKGHIIFVALMVLLETHHGSCEWAVVERHLRKFFWEDSLAVQWKAQWEAAVTRQQLWEQQGYFRLGPKRENAVVEYLVLRNARGSMPLIESLYKAL
jgi:hypothetical protein